MRVQRWRLHPLYFHDCGAKVKPGSIDQRDKFGMCAMPDEERLLQAQEHAIACGNLALELQSALGMLLIACEEAGWPKTAEQMAPMNMARAAMKKNLERREYVARPMPEKLNHPTDYALGWNACIDAMRGD